MDSVNELLGATALEVVEIDVVPGTYNAGTSTFAVVDVGGNGAGNGSTIELATKAAMTAAISNAVISAVGAAYSGATSHKAIAVVAGVAVLTKVTAGIDYTIANPVATTDDFKRIVIVSVTAANHVVAATINGSSASLTFDGAIGDNIELVAYQGGWFTVGCPNGVIVGSPS